jgi:hypothetical protein
MYCFCFTEQTVGASLYSLSKLLCKDRFIYFLTGQMTKNLSNMKKLMYGALFLAAVGIGVVGCRKESLQKQMVQDVNSSSEFNITSDGRMLIFESIDDYKKVVNDPSDESKAKFLNEVANLKHTTYAELLSLKKSESNDLLGDDDLAQILNEDWIVQIGDYLYRVNKPTESVYVLPASNVDQYEDLVNENKSNKNIRKFSTEDDVIELAENGAEGQKGLFCGEGGVGSRSATINHGSAPNTNSGVTSTLRHSKFGIYFTIVMESYSNWALSQFKFEFPTSSDQRRFKRRCETVEYVPYSGTNQWQSLMSVTEAKYKIRENVSNFSKYHIRARCHYYHNDLFMSQADLVSTSAWLEIRINY